MGDRIEVQFPVQKNYFSVTSHPSQLSLAIPRWVGAKYRPKGGDALRLGVKADMVLFAGDHLSCVIHI